MRRQGQKNDDLDGHNVFERLREDIYSANAISSNRGFQVKKSHGHPVDQLSTNRNREEGIRKDITVSVTFGDSSEPERSTSQAFPASNTSNHHQEKRNLRGVSNYASSV